MQNESRQVLRPSQIHIFQIQNCICQSFADIINDDLMVMTLCFKKVYVYNIQ